jgi:hypothetical protein
MTIKYNEVYTFKLITGEEIVAKILGGRSDSGFDIEHPILCVLGPQGLQMMPYMLSAKMGDKLELNTHSWVMFAEARDDVRDSWIQATTGIAPVRKQIITG